MPGEINKQYKMGEVLTSLKYVTEVYSSTDFTFTKDGADFTLLCSQKIDTAKAYYEISALFSMPVHLYVIFDAFSGLLEPLRIIWREGKWYL